MDFDIASRSLWEILDPSSDMSVLETHEAFKNDFLFLSIFHGYTQVWCDDAYEVLNLSTKVAVTVKAIRKELQKCAYLVAFPSKWSDVLPCLWRKTRHLIAARQSRDSTLLQSFAKLKEKIELLKQEINDLQSLSEKTDFTASLRSQLLKLGRSLQYLSAFLSESHRVLSHPVMEDVMAHHGAIVIRAAHLCCFCWAVKMDENMERDVSVLVSDLVNKIDLAASPEFVEMLLGCLENCYPQLCKVGWGYAPDMRTIERSFVRYLLHLEEEPCLIDELLSLIICVTQIPRVHNKDIATVIRDAAAIKFNDSRTRKSFARPKLPSITCNKFDLVVLFARIWFLKSKIFLEEQANGTNLDLCKLSTGYQIRPFIGDPNIWKDISAHQKRR
ncbi:hypothetical protein ACH5RR_040518 [Cinchona calisaya]|uniref:Uncharacterized protein n=1 Tax=Cinchona calisaya TaxID=153742 RepID=A0ABD2XTQ5_9GENT